MAKTNLLESAGISPIQLIILGGGAYFIYTVTTKVGEKFGIVKSDTDLANEQKSTGLNSMPQMSPSYLSKLGATKVMKFKNKSTLQNIVASIYKSKGVFNDNEAMLYGAFKMITYKTQLAEVSQAFYKDYNYDLYQYLKTFLNDSELALIYDYLNKLPTGIV